MNQNDLVINVKSISSGFNDSLILDDVSMIAKKHEITVIIGSSGCGKTTLLKHLIRLYLPWSGSIQIFGREITDMDEPEFNEFLLSIGVLFQNGALLNSINVAENVAIPLEQHTNLPYRIIERLIRVKLNLVELNHAFLKLPSELSGGMRKRAALARAIALDPALLLCDEPSAGLDPVTLEALDQLVLKMRDELGMSIVIVTHDLASIYRIADRVLFLDDGKVLFEGTLKETLDCGIDKVNAFFKRAPDLFLTDKQDQRFANISFRAVL